MPTTETKPVAMDWYEVHRISDDISLIREAHVAWWLRCNMWHVRGRDHDLLIDTGAGFRPLKREVVQLAEKPVKAILSHSHFDHMGGAHEFDCRLGHRTEAHLCADPTADDGDGPVSYFPFIREETFSALPHEGFEYQSYAVTPAPLTGYLDEGDVIDLGDRIFDVFHMPGHSPGSIALYEEKTRTLFSGDIVYNGDLFDTVYHSDRDAYRDSLMRLRELRVETIHGGHYESFDRDRLLEIIDLYLAGKGRMGDATAWVASKL